MKMLVYSSALLLVTASALNAMEQAIVRTASEPVAVARTVTADVSNALAALQDRNKDDKKQVESRQGKSSSTMSTSTKLKIAGATLAVGLAGAAAYTYMEASHSPLTNKDTGYQAFYKACLTEDQRNKFHEMLVSIEDPLKLFDENGKWADSSREFRRTLTVSQAIELIRLIKSEALNGNTKSLYVAFQQRILSLLKLHTTDADKKLTRAHNAHNKTVQYMGILRIADEPIAHGIGVKDDSLALATAHKDGTIRIWNLQKGTCSRVIMNVPNDVILLEWNPAGNIIAAITMTKIMLYESLTGKLICDWMREGKGTVTCCSFNPDGTKLATATDKGYIHIWPCQTGDLIKRFYVADLKRAPAPVSRWLPSSDEQNIIEIKLRKDGEVVMLNQALQFLSSTDYEFMEQADWEKEKLMNLATDDDDNLYLCSEGKMFFVPASGGAIKVAYLELPVALFCASRSSKYFLCGYDSTKMIELFNSANDTSVVKFKSEFSLGAFYITGGSDLRVLGVSKNGSEIVLSLWKKNT